MVVMVLKQYFKKQKSKTIKYRSHKNFCNDGFRSQLLHDLNKGLMKISGLDHFNATVPNVLHNKAPKIMKYARVNEAPFMNRAVKKTIMKKTRFRNKLKKTI